MFIGIDVSKKKFDICLLEADCKPIFAVFENEKKGFQAFTDWLKEKAKDSQPVIIIESTGVYSLQLSYFLHQAGHFVSLADARAVHKFAQALSLKVKTDKRDAQTIAEFGWKISAKRWKPTPESLLRLRELLSIRAQLEQDLAGYENRKEHCLMDGSLQHLEAIKSILEQQLAKLNDEIEDLIEEDEDLKTDQRLLESIPGIAEKTAQVLLSEIAGLERFGSARDLASYAGIVPSVRQSGTSVKGSGAISRSGSRKLRAALYWPAISAIRHNKPLREFAERLKEKGKSGKKVIVAVMRKLLQMVYGILKHKQPFNPNHLQNMQLTS